MRADPNHYANVNNALQVSQSNLQTAMDQLSSGKRVTTPSQDPLAFAQNLRSLDASANVDRYTRNAESVSSQVQTADAVLSGVVTSLTQAISIGTQGGNSDLTPAQRSNLVVEVNGLIQNVVASANQTLGGQALFGGTAGAVTPFTEDPASPGLYLYQGGTSSAVASIGDGLTVTTSIPGNQIFQNPNADVFGALQQLAKVLPSGDGSQIAQAVGQVSAALGYIGQVRAEYSDSASRLSQQTSFLSQETLTLTSQQQNLVSVELASAATALTQAQLGNSAVLAMAAKVLPESLLNYLH